eukprot:TRINITY_DN12643_c0_g1_i4.p1 TRINITY_DN12643_c0_g1~~TRINITY_DN12643_c0_g1_i4.p1  ORF type:complete len:118 (-),score=11.58 TRINITY_DN12643_c0_g1_i4:281-634(-)
MLRSLVGSEMCIRDRYQALLAITDQAGSEVRSERAHRAARVRQTRSKDSKIQRSKDSKVKHRKPESQHIMAVKTKPASHAGGCVRPKRSSCLPPELESFRPCTGRAQFERAQQYGRR